jgi:DNA invertase Pin-like site-specific DNA recombinase
MVMTKIGMMKNMEMDHERIKKGDMKKTYAYIRTNQDLCTWDQYNSIIKYSDDINLSISEYIREVKASGSNLNRKGIQKIIKECEADNVSCIIIDKLDRLSRNIKDLVSLIELFKEKNIRLISISEGLDTKNKSSKLTLEIFCQTERLLGELEEKPSKTECQCKTSILMSKGCQCGGA